MNLYTILGPALTLGLIAPTTTEADVRAHQKRDVDLVICLDTSGSMKGLIDSARQNIWAIVNDLALAKPEPRLRVSLLTFGNAGHAEEAGWVKVDVPLTDDLDLISQKLFALVTNGGEEYVGRVLTAAVDKLEWSQQKSALKLIVVAGNEAASQDPEIDHRAAAGAAIAKGILVNSVYCGKPSDDVAPGWKEVALRADGQFATIDKDNGTVVIETPFDAQLTGLSAKVNGTYLPFGAKGKKGKDNQVAQDNNASGLNGAASAQRARSKAWGGYNCATWDLVDGCAHNTVDLAKLKPEELPEIMRPMTIEQRKEYVAKKAAERKSIQKQIAEIHVKREAFVVEERKRQAVDGSAAFDFAVRRAVKAQAEAKGFTFRGPGGQTAAAGTAEKK